MKQDYYDGLIQERGRDAAAPLLADECRKADKEIALLKELLNTVMVAIDAEPEYPGEMPDTLLAKLQAALDKNSIELLATALRETVKLTKKGIRDRITSTPNAPSERTAVAGTLNGVVGGSDSSEETR